MNNTDVQMLMKMLMQVICMTWNSWNRRLLLLGHTADLSVVAACRVVKAAARWASYKLIGPVRTHSARPSCLLDRSRP